jgi:hypothetical protein
MIEVLERYLPHIISAFTQAGPSGLIVKELRASLGIGEQFARRALILLLAIGAACVSHCHQSSRRGSVPRVYLLAEFNVLAQAATPTPYQEGVTE